MKLLCGNKLQTCSSEATQTDILSTSLFLFVLDLNMKQDISEKGKHPQEVIHELINASKHPHSRSAQRLSRAASITHLGAGVLAAGRAAFPPLIGAEGGGAGALVMAAVTRPCPGTPPLPCLAPLLATLVSGSPFTPAGWVMDCLAAFLFSALSRSCHHF